MAKNRRDLYDDENATPSKINRSTIKHLAGIYQFMLPYKVAFFVGLTSLLLSSVIMLAFPFFTGKLVDAALGKGQWILKSINSISLALLGILVIQSVFSFFRVFFFTRVSENAMADIRKALYRKLMGLPMSFYDQRRAGELMSRITADVAMLQDTFSIALAEFFRQICVLVFGLIILFFTTPRLTFFMLGVIPVLVLSGLFFGRFIRKLSKKTQDELANANVVVEETLQSVAVVKAFTNEDYETSRYENALNKVVLTALAAANYRGGFVSFIVLALFGGIVAVLWYGAGLVAIGEISVGDLTSFVIYTMFIGGSIGGLGDLYGQLQKAVGASERVLEILSKTSEGEDSQTQKLIELKLKGKIEFQNVQFTYPTRPEMQVLKGINFSVRAGEKVALVGHSGAGKSTIIQLLMRFYDLENGAILVDDKNINQYHLQNFRSHLSIVPQEVILFGGTIKENIAYGKPNATEAELIAAAQQANAWKFIDSFPDKLNTLVGDRGMKLSGGQKQRIAIARAILKNPEILILDEATSSLDAESELLVQDALDELMKNRTSIIIAHRLATIRKVDTIYVLDGGRITQKGSHEELIAQPESLYANLIKLQMLND